MTPLSEKSVWEQNRLPGAEETVERLKAIDAKTARPTPAKRIKTFADPEFKQIVEDATEQAGLTSRQVKEYQTAIEALYYHFDQISLEDRSFDDDDYGSVIHARQPGLRAEHFVAAVAMVAEATSQSYQIEFNGTETTVGIGINNIMIHSLAEGTWGADDYLHTDRAD